MSNSVRPLRRQPTRLRRPWDSPDKNTGVGCHFLLQCMKVKSESEVTQSCHTRSDPMDWGQSHPWDFPGKSTGVGCHCLHVREDWGKGYPLQYSGLENSLYSPWGDYIIHGVTKSRIQLRDFHISWTVARQAPLSMGFSKARILEWVAVSFSRGSSRPRDPTCVSCIAGGFFALWAHLGSPVWSFFSS